MRPPEAPCRRVVPVGGLVGGVEIAEAEAHPAELDLGGEAAGGARTDATVSPSFPATRRRGEKERGESGGEAQSGERAVARHRAVGGRVGRRMPKLAQRDIGATHNYKLIFCWTMEAITKYFYGNNSTQEI